MRYHTILDTASVLFQGTPWVKEFATQPGVQSERVGSPDGFVVFDLVFDHGVKDYCDFVGSRSGSGTGTELRFHSAQIVAQGSGAMMEGKCCQAKDMTSAIFDRSY